MRTLSGYCYDLSFQRPNVKQICAAIKTVCFKEKISIDLQALTEMVVASGQDMRQVRGVLGVPMVTRVGVAQPVLVECCG